MCQRSLSGDMQHDVWNECTTAMHLCSFTVPHMTLMTALQMLTCLQLNLSDLFNIGGCTCFELHMVSSRRL